MKCFSLYLIKPKQHLVCALFAVAGMFALIFPVGPALANEATQYPREIQTPGGNVRVYHPTVTDWKNFEVLSAWVPVEIFPQGSTESWTGSVKVQAVTEVDFENRVVSLSGLRPVSAVADESLPESGQSLKDFPGAYTLLQRALEQARQSVSLEYLLRALPEDFAAKLIKPTQGLDHSPPRIIISEEPAMLMLLDGPPRTAPIRHSDLEIVVNTDWTVFHHKQSDHWYLVFGDYWLKNPTLSGGTWLVASELPEEFSSLSAISGWEGLSRLLPPKQTDRIPPPFKLSYEPAELVLFDGEPEWQPLVEGGLKFAANSDHDVFLLDQRYYLLLSGRWFSSRDLRRQWSAVKELPEVFGQIPPNSQKAYILAAVPGTEEFRIALLEAAMPRTQTVSNESGDGLVVTYDGDPEFVTISGTPLQRAVNTSKQVLRHNNFYYLCQDAAWFSSSSPTGPWRPALEIPEAIYDIPPEDPAYNVTFVKLGTFDQDTGRQAYIHTYGYSGTYTADKGLVHGIGPTASGTYYDPTYDPRQRNDMYWPGNYWPAYGYGARYYPWHGGWRYGGYYDPFWGYPYPYPRSSSVTIDLPDDNRDWEIGPDGEKRTVNTSPARNYVGSGTYRVDGQSTGQDDPTAKGHWYSGPDGRLYRMTQAGWEIQQGKKWVSVTEPVPYSVTREYQARLSGYAGYQRFQQEQAANPQ